MAGFTNRGKYLMLGWVFRGDALPTNFYVALCTDASAPGADTNLLGDLTQVPTGNGYTTGGYQLTPGGTDFDVHTESDASDIAYVQIKDVVWTASGGQLPSSGSGARYAVLTDDQAVVANRQIIAYFDLVSNRIVSDSQPLTLQNMQLTLSES